MAGLPTSQAEMHPTEAPPRYGYSVVCGTVVAYVWSLEDAASLLAGAFESGMEYHVYACPGPHDRRELRSSEHARLVSAAASRLAA